MRVPPLVFRIPKGAPLSSEEHDSNLSTIRDFCDGLSRLFEVVFNPDGTLKNDTIGSGSLQDRSVTQPKLDWLANFFGTASGVDNYSVTISPDAGFGYGDGAADAFFCIVKFTNANTGAADLDVNTGGAKPIKKPGGANLTAGDIAAGSVHLLVYDGANFQLMSAVPATPLNTPLDKGMPTFLTPVVISTGAAAVGWTTYNTLVADGVPVTASALILEAVWCIKNNAGEASILIRSESGADEYVLARGLGDPGHTQAASACNQGVFPLKESAGVLSVDYKVVLGFDFNYTLRLIGFIS